MNVDSVCLEKVIAAFEWARQDGGKAIVVEGDVGSGKTALLDTFSAHARERGATVLRAVASRADSGVPLGVFRQLADGIRPPRRRAQLAHLLSDSALSAGPNDDQLTPDAQLGAAVESVCRVLIKAAGCQPVVLVVDDVHHADFASMLCLAHLSRRLVAAHILLVITNTRGVQPLHPLIHAEVLRESGDRIVIQKLSGMTINRLLAERLDGAVTTSLACVLLAASGGNPLLVNALIEDCRRSSVRPYELHAADEFDRAVLGCLCRFDARTIQVAHAVALLDDPDSQTILPRLLGCPHDVVDQALGTLESVGVVHRSRFRHPRARTAVLSSLSADERSELHRRAAVLLHQRSAAATVVATHLASSDQMCGSWSIPLMQEAAELALADEHLELAQDYLQLALDRCDDAGQRAATRFKLMSAEWWISPAVAARHLDEILAAAGAGHLSQRDAVKVADHLLWQGRIDDVVALIEGMKMADQTDGQLVRTLQNLCRTVRHVFPGLTPGPPPTAADPVTGARSADEEAIQGLRAFLLAPRLDDHTLGRALGSLGAVFLTARPLDAVHDLIEEGEGLTVAPTWRAVAAAIRAESAFQRGAPAEARMHAQNALTLIAPRGWGVAIGAPLTTLINVALESRWPEAAAELVDIPVPAAMFQSTLGWRYLSARGRFHLIIGRRQEALSDFEAADKLAAARGLEGVPRPVPLRADDPAGSPTFSSRMPGLISRTRAGSELSPVVAVAATPMDRLSDAERRVVRLAALGRTNRLISNELFVTISTVEQHLTQAYRKLGVPGRSHLPAMLEPEDQRVG